MTVTAQVSVYPLGQDDLQPAIEAVWAAFRTAKLQYRTGAMSTLVEGEADVLFAALARAFQAAAQRGATVMVATVSNACPPMTPLEG